MRTTARVGKIVRKKKTPKKTTVGSYEVIKDYQGKQYVGMQIGRSHKWYYDKGEWKDKKITPDLWEIHYAVTKRRAGKAPKEAVVSSCPPRPILPVLCTMRAAGKSQ